MGYRKVETGRPTYKPLSPEMKEAKRQLERYSNQVRLVCREKLETIDGVKEYISKVTDEIKEKADERQRYRNKLRNCKDDVLIKEYKGKICECSDFLIKQRFNLKVANQIIEDVSKIKETIRIEKKMKRQELEQGKIKNKEL